MKISQKGIELIKKWEGSGYLTAYQDVVGVWTIGYGHTKGVYKGMSITQKQAEDFLKDDIESHVSYMKQVIKVTLNQNQFDALASFHFNLGAYVLQQDQTLLGYINNKKWDMVCNQMMKYVNAGGKFVQGLYNRRLDETNLFKTGVDEYWNETGAYELLVDDCFYCEPAFKNKSVWAPKKGSVIVVDEVVKYGNVNRGAVMLGTTKRYITLNKRLIKRI